MARRREEIRKLQNERTRLRQLDKTAVSSTDRDSLLVGSDGKSYGRETDNTRDFTTQQLVDRSANEMKNQDAILEQMSNGLTNLKNIGVAIQDETTLHMVSGVATWGSCFTLRLSHTRRRRAIAPPPQSVEIAQQP